MVWSTRAQEELQTRFGHPALDPQKRPSQALYAVALYQNDSATLNDIRETVATLEDTQRTARRVLGSAHPLFGLIERDLQKARAALRARETPGSA